MLPNKFLKWTSYVLLSNIYAAGGNGHLCEDIERQRKEKGAKKQLGCTWIEVNNEVHMFVVEDQDHPQMMEIHAELQRLSRLMHDAGYVPCTEFVLDDEEEKLFHFCNHSEKLAYCIRAYQHSSWYSSLNMKKSAGLQRLPHFYKVHFKDSWESNHVEGCQLLSDLRMVLVVAWTIGDASSLACQSLNEVHLVFTSISSGLLT